MKECCENCLKEIEEDEDAQWTEEGILLCESCYWAMRDEERC